MQKTLLIFVMLAILMLSACSPADASSVPDSQITEQIEATAQPQPVPLETMPAEALTAEVALTADYEDAASVEAQLILGIFNLEDTGLLVTRDQASLLAPLWMNYKTLTATARPPAQEQDQPTASQPVDAETQEQMTELTAQIQAVLTPEQLQAIVDMEITTQDMQVFMDEQGISLRGPQQGEGNMPPEGGPGPGNGQAPAGTPPSDSPGQGIGQPADNGMPPQGQARAGFVPSLLIDALLKFLESKTL